MKPELSELNEEQYRANRFELISRLADDLAHEIKNPLNAIIVNLEVIRVRAGRGDTAAVSDRAAVIEHETRRLHELIDRLLQLLRPTREEAASLALDQALDEVLPLIAAQAKLARNEFTSTCHAPIYVPVRRDVFKFAMLNILTAVHEQLGEGRGTLSLDCSCTEEIVRLTVRAARDGTPLSAAPDVARAGRFDNALAVAGALLAPCRGTVDGTPGSVVISLPRGAGA